jgi:hypothetical protein
MLFTAENGKEGSTKDTSGKEGICKGSEDTVRGMHHDVSAREERRKEMN